MSDPSTTVASKPAATSTTIQGAAIQLVVSLVAVLALLFPKDADKINTIGQTIVGYAPVIAGVIVAVAPFVMTVLGRFKAAVPLH